MYLVSVILLLYYIGTKKKLRHFLPPSPLPIVPIPPIISFWRNFQPPDIPNPPTIRYSRVLKFFG